MSIRLFATLLGALALDLAPASAADSGDALLAKHRAFVGWTFGDGTLTSWRSETRYKPSSTATPDPNQTPDPEATPSRGLVLHTVRRGVQYRNTAVIGEGISEDDGFTGRVFWSSNMNGYTVTVLRDRAGELLTENMLEDEELPKLSGETRGTAKVRDVETHVVRVKPQQGVAVDLYIDNDGAYRRIVLAPDSDSKQTIEIDKYMEVAPGKKVVGEYHYDSSGSYVVDNFEPNVAISDDQLHPPAPRPVWSFGDGLPVPIDVVRHTAIFGETGGRAVMLRASINGHEGTFLLDSGSYACMVFGAFGDSLKLPKVGSTSFGSLMAGTVGANIVNVDELKIGNNVLRNVSFVQTRNAVFDKFFDGIIGYDVLAGALVDVEVDGHKLRILDPTKFDASPGRNAAVFPLDLTTRHAVVQITVANNVPGYAIVDTGNDYTLLISDEFRRSGKLVGTGAPTGFSGVDMTNCIRPQRIMIGPIPFENGLTCFVSPRLFGHDGALLGFDFLRHFNWTFDYPHARLILTPNGIK
jgi:hypothetical protein